MYITKLCSVYVGSEINTFPFIVSIFFLSRSMVQAVHGKHFSQKQWTKFLNTRAVPWSGVCFADIEVMLCDVPSCYEHGEEEDMEGIITVA